MHDCVPPPDDNDYLLCGELTSSLNQELWTQIEWYKKKVSNVELKMLIEFKSVNFYNLPEKSSESRVTSGGTCDSWLTHRFTHTHTDPKPNVPQWTT